MRWLVGEFVRIKEIKNKRVWGRVTEVKSVPNEWALVIKSVYRPSPKSVLKNKRVFSKIKMTIE